MPAKSKGKNKEKTFTDYLVNREKKIIVELNGKNYPLKRYTIQTEMFVLATVDMTRKDFAKNLQDLDGETLCKTLWAMMEKNEDFPSWEDLAAVMSADVLQKAQIAAAISASINQSMPELGDELEKNIKKLQVQLIQNVKKATVK